jgi:hypothetical protein
VIWDINPPESLTDFLKIGLLREGYIQHNYGDFSASFTANIATQLRRKRAPGRVGENSIQVNGPWCITFEWNNGRALRVDLEQYH